MYTLAEVLRILDENYTAICISGELKDFELFIRNGNYEVEEPDGTYYFLADNFDDAYDKRYSNTKWILVDN